MNIVNTKTGDNSFRWISTQPKTEDYAYHLEKIVNNLVTEYLRKIYPLFLSLHSLYIQVLTALL
jgi:hypothetical protein